jgi:hypothetical protein
MIPQGLKLVSRVKSFTLSCLASITTTMIPTSSATRKQRKSASNKRCFPKSSPCSSRSTASRANLAIGKGKLWKPPGDLRRQVHFVDRAEALPSGQAEGSGEVPSDSSRGRAPQLRHGATALRLMEELIGASGRRRTLLDEAR